MDNGTTKWDAASYPHNENQVSISALFRFARHVTNASLYDFARILSTTAESLYAFEKNTLMLPRENLRCACKALGLNPLYLDDKNQNPFNYRYRALDVPVYPYDIYDKAQDLCYIAKQTQILTIAEPPQGDNAQLPEGDPNNSCHSMAAYDIHGNLVILYCRSPKYGPANPVDIRRLTTKMLSARPHLGRPAIKAIRAYAPRALRRALTVIGGVRFCVETILAAT